MRRWYSLILVSLLLLGFGWWYFREDPDLAAARALQAQLAALGEKATWEDRRKLMDQMRGHMENLTEEQRRSLFQEMRAPFQNQMRAAVDGYFALPPAQREAYLDQQIREMERRRAAMQQRFAARPPGESPPGAGGRPPRGDRPGGGPNAGPGGGPGGRDAGGSGMLDRSTPVERARNTAYTTAIQKRRKELGLPEMGFGRR